MNRRLLPSKKYLRQCFSYERSTGKLFWKRRPRSHFSRTIDWKGWNTNFAGREIDSKTNGRYQHIRLKLNDTIYFAHRIIWKIQTGKEPPPIIDHKDRNGSNNKWKNLRKATVGQNRTNNGFTRGFYFRKGKWEAYIKYNKKNHHLGRFTSELAALLARRKAAAVHHGEFVP